MEIRFTQKLLFFTLVLFHLGSASQEQIIAADYFPLQSGNSWTYRVNSFSTETFRVSSGTVTINGIATKEIRSTTTNSAFYYTNDNNGIRLHREILDGDAVTVNPPWRFTDAVASIGERFNSSGTATVELSGFPAVSVNYTANITVTGSENVTVPAGTFETIRLSGTLEISGTVNGEDIEGSQTMDVWVVEHLGPVKQTINFDGDIETVELITASIDHDEDGLDDNTDTDDDGDGISDDVENTFGLDPFDPGDASGDLDNDGLTNLEEVQLGTGINIVDSDNDGTSDGDEVAQGSNPLVDEEIVIQLLNILLPED